MQAAQFSNQESQQPTLQMQVRRLSKKKIEASSSSSERPPTEIDNNSLSPLSSLSSSTNKRIHTITKTNYSTKEIQKTSTQAQQHRVNQKEEKSNRSIAHKQATRMYAMERNKTGGLSAQKVSDSVFDDTGI